jgi:hypothetical protein
MIEGLKAARDLLSVPGQWTKRQAARDKDGNMTGPHSPDAVCWCLIGALAKCKVPTYGPMRDKIVRVIYDRYPETNGGLVSFNDSQESVEPILEVLDIVIEELSK